MSLYITDFFTALATADHVHVDNHAVCEFHFIGNALAVVVQVDAGGVVSGGVLRASKRVAFGRG